MTMLSLGAAAKLTGLGKTTLARSIKAGVFDVCNVSLNRLIECDALSAEDQFMQLLSMLGFDR
jgi:hypothetical protein